MNVALRRYGFWHGPDWEEAERIFDLCTDLGMSAKQAFFMGHTASWPECYAFTRNLAERSKCSTRTGFRALARAASLGISKSERAPKGSAPDRVRDRAAFKFGYAVRKIIGRGLPIEARSAAIGRARVRWITNLARRAQKPAELVKLRNRPPGPRQSDGMTVAERAAWIDRKLAELDATKPTRAGPS